MRHNAGQLGRNMGKFLRQGGGVPLDELTTFAGGQADSFREITFNESGPDADLYAFTEYVEESGPGPTVVHVERISIPLAMISEDNPWLWGSNAAISRSWRAASRDFDAIDVGEILSGMGQQ